MLARKASRCHALILTFDDGPSSKLTPAILDILAENNAKATFFLLGKNIAGREEIVKQIAEQGHEICSHGYGHLHYWKVSPFRTLSDIKRGWEAINATLGITRQKYPFRPPNGKLNIFCLLYLVMWRVPIVYWTFDLGDTSLSLKRNGQKIMGLAKEPKGAVVLAHDFERVNESTSKMVLQSVRSALALAEEEGMKVLTISQFLKASD